MADVQTSNEGERRWTDRPMFALDTDVTVYWPDVRPCYEDDHPSWCKCSRVCGGDQ